MKLLLQPSGRIHLPNGYNIIQGETMPTTIGHHRTEATGNALPHTATLAATPGESIPFALPNHTFCRAKRMV